MGKNKLKHFAEMLSFPNVLQFDKSNRGGWSEKFGNANPITLELACGKGEYTVGLAQVYSDRNFIGVDIKGARIYTGAKRSLDLDLKNVKFLRTQIDHLPEYFASGEVTEMWITYPDPFIPLSDAHRRLTSTKYIEVYRKIMSPGSIVHLKTDDDGLYLSTLDVIAELKLTLHEKIDDVYALKNRDPRLDIKTYYEQKHLIANKTIKYVRFAI